MWRVGDRFFHLQFPNNTGETGLCRVTSMADPSRLEIQMLANGRYVRCYHEDHRYSEDEGTRLILAGVRCGKDMLALFGSEVAKWPYIREGKGGERIA